MNFRNLQYFLRAAEEKNITHAARKLFISQQSLSEHISKLEEELGVTLFERGPELKLTYAGERLALLAQRICDLEQEIIREADEISDHRRGKLRIGITYTCGRAILPSLLPDFRKKHPLVEIRLMEGNSRQLKEWLEKGETDVIIDYAPIDVPGTMVYPLLTERLFLVCPKTISEHLLGMDAAVMRRENWKGFDIGLLRTQPFILLRPVNRVRTVFDVYLEKNCFQPNVILETENIETAFSLAEGGMGISVYPELFLNNLHAYSFEEDSSLDLIPLYTHDTVGTLAIAFMEIGYHAPAVLDFIAMCRQKFNEVIK